MSKIKNVKLKNFRVYKDETFNIDLSSRIILFYGNNGLGKTSFFDGIEWGLTGNIQRYRYSAKEKNEYYILHNTFSGFNEESYVQITLDNNIEIRRDVNKKNTKDFNKGKIESGINLDKILISEEYLNKIVFEDTFGFSQLLSQELINNFIREKDTERYSSIKNILGLHRYEKYEDFINDILKEIINEKKKIEPQVNDFEYKFKIAEAKKSKIDIPLELIKNKESQYLNNEDINKDLSTKIDIISDKISNNIDNLNKTIKKSKQLKNNIINLKRLNKDAFLQHEESLKKLKDLKQNKIKYKNNLELLYNYNNIKYLYDNLKRYQRLYCDKEKYQNIIRKYITVNKELNNLKHISNDFDLALNYLESYPEYKGLIKKYKENNEHYTENRTKYKAREQELRKLQSIKQQFLTTTIGFLEKNMQLKNCPVCNQNFEIEKTIRNLESQLNDCSESSVSTSIKVLKNLDKQNEEILLYKSKLESEIKKKVSNCLQEKESEFDELRKQYEDAIINLKFLKEFSIELGKANIEANQVKAKRVELVEKLAKNNVEYNIEKYVGLLRNIESQEDKVSNEILEFQLQLKKNKVDSIEDVKDKISSIESLTEEINKSITKFEISVEELNNIKSFYVDKIQSDKIHWIKSKLDSLNKTYNKLCRLEKSFKNMSNHARDVLLNETTKILESDRLQIKKIYGYLNPNHNFDNLNIRIDDSNPKNNRLILEAVSKNGNVINPAFSFSSAQNNVLAVSIFLSIALSQNWSKLDCIFMDDPIQNMDDINITNFVDLLRNIVKKTDRQIFISTHDKRIFDFMRNKFGSSAQCFEFVDYGQKLLK